MIQPKVRNGTSWIDLKPQLRNGLVWTDLLPRQSGQDDYYENVEVGAYTTWFDDPSNSIMLHYQTVDDTPIECLFRKEGTLDWHIVNLYADNPFPHTQKRVRWFKLEGLQPNSTYETKLKNHKQIHRFKTMPSTFVRNIKFSMVSDQLNSESAFWSEAPRGFQTMFNNNIDVLIIAGDAVHDDGALYYLWGTFWDEYFKQERKNNLMLPIVTCFGNHDGRISNSDGTLKNLLWYQFGARKENVIFHYNFFSNLNDLGYGAIDISDYMSLIYLNSNHTQPIQGTQTQWLENALVERNDRHIFPFMHVSPYPAYYDYETTYIKDIRDYWTPLFAQYGVKIVGSGHEHAHLVTKKVVSESLNDSGVVFTGQGHGMGNVSRGIAVTQDTWYVDYLDIEQRGFDIIEFKTDKSVYLKKVSLDGLTLYEKTL